MKVKIFFLILGLGLVIGYANLTPKGLDVQTQDLIAQAQSLPTQTFFPGYDLSRYPVDVYGGNVEYRYFQGHVQKKDRALPIFAMTIDVEENGPVIKVCNLSDMRRISDLGYKDKEGRRADYLALLAHEGFHAFQWDQGYLAQVEALMQESDRLAEALGRLDRNKTYQDLWLAESAALEEWLHGQGGQETWQEAYQARLARQEDLVGVDLASEVTATIAIYEKVEGGARYIEDRTRAYALGQTYQAKKDPVFRSGKAKTYDSGCLKMALLDKYQRGLVSSLYQDGKSLDTYLQALS